MMSWDIELGDQILQDLYAWIDQIQLSRPKKRIEKDFADGVMVAELIKYYFPSWVDLHNYAAANSTQQKLINWGLLNRKIFCRFGLNVPEHIMRGICLGRAGLIEIFLYNLRTKIDDYLYGMETHSSDPQYRILHHKEKTSEANTLTSRQVQQYSSPTEQSSMSKSRINGGNVSKKSQSMYNLNTDMVSRIEYDEKEQESIAKDEEIQILQAKIRRLEHLLHLKDVRVDELSMQLDQTRNLTGAGVGSSDRRQPTHMPFNGRFDNFTSINIRMSVHQPKINTSDQQQVSRRPTTTASSTEVFKPSAVTDIPELSKENLLNMLNQIPDLQGRQFNIEYAPSAASEGYPIPTNLDYPTNSYPEPVFIDKLPNDVIKHVKSSNNKVLTAALEATIQKEQNLQSADRSEPTSSSLYVQPTTIMHHVAQPHEQVQQSRSVSANDSDSSTEVSSSTTTSSSSEETDSEESESIPAKITENCNSYDEPFLPKSYSQNQYC
ncbi:unnamed protein product [Rotaria socialis]|uniref:Calponin-homology (CH) domain-containing protein n=2 Tax=Rotaria socialis TaxID=392032 RepID=A0A821KGF0_9BILA|nr:unnamed protein product [Rotaria socialis]CAF4738447.1 unnamed protein product [Rotaria socialis]